jgi:uncharacterized membrane protein YcaP (DUF421 family)
MTDWRQLFALHTPLLEIIVRGSVVYLALYVMLRAVLKREAGTTGMTDLLVIVLIADAAQNAMAGQYVSITDGLILVATIVVLAYLLDILAYRFPLLRRLIEPRPLLLIKDGVVIRRNLRREFITDDELRAQLRERGIEDVAQVRRAYMEPDGQFSIITREPHGGNRGRERRVY